MKLIHSFPYSALFVIFLIFITSCHQRIELEYDYTDFSRVMGPEGGTINFCEYNPTDSVPEILVSMEFPQNALDSLVVFNMYEFDNRDLYVDLYYLGIEYYTKFLYFVPFSEKTGYNEQDSLIERHDSIDFNVPVSVTYNISEYQVLDTARLYRICIPRNDRWDVNVWVEWNTEGWPIGYDPVDLKYLINGRWTETKPWGSQGFSKDNWEEVNDYIFNPLEGTIKFDIDNLDYMYVMAAEYY